MTQYIPLQRSRLAYNNIHAYIHTLYLNFFLLHCYYTLTVFVSRLLMYVFTPAVLFFCMSVCVFLRKQSHFTKHSLLFTQHVLCILRDFQSVRIDRFSSYEHIPIFNRLNKIIIKQKNETLFTCRSTPR